MTFGEALEGMKHGALMAREGWNGKRMYVGIIQFPDYEPCVYMFTAQKTKVLGWLASQSDMLAEDWVMVKR